MKQTCWILIFFQLCGIFKLLIIIPYVSAVELNLRGDKLKTLLIKKELFVLPHHNFIAHAMSNKTDVANDKSFNYF